MCWLGISGQGGEAHNDRYSCFPFLSLPSIRENTDLGRRDSVGLVGLVIICLMVWPPFEGFMVSRMEATCVCSCVCVWSTVVRRNLLGGQGGTMIGSGEG